MTDQPAAATAPETDTGIYFDTKASPGFIARLVVDLVDVVMLILIMSAVTAAPFLLSEMEIPLPAEPTLRRTSAVLIAIFWRLYLVPLKRSGVGTVGYILFQLKVIDLQGRPPGLLRMTGRTLFTLVFNHVLDLIYLATNRSRQALRDQLSGTYVVRRSARPAGHGPIVYSRIFFFGMALIYREVNRKS